MSVPKFVGQNQKAVLAAMRHSNEALLEVMKPLFASSEPFVKATSEVTGTDQLPTPKEVVEQWFGFVEEVLKEEKAFLLNVADLIPELPPKTQPLKAAPKAA